ncbi:MAG: RlmE family RNA methyltransferase [Proteobacteria bacterium]|nr:RlmE family RNA methyltransferase [Pseudomonadota bacterium]
MPRRPQDTYGRRARREGYPARSVYKLEELDRRLGLLRPGGRVLDLGASPGSWLLYCAQRVARQGRVVGLDLKPLARDLPPQARFEQHDVAEPLPSAATQDAPFDVVLSDMAPNTTGQAHVDHYRSYELFMRALELASELLRPQGSFVAKLFQGAEFDNARRAVGQHFARVRIVRPRASRRESSELFIAGLARIG